MKVPEFTSLNRKPLTTEELAAHYQVSTRTIANWRDAGKIPFLRITARCFRYDLDQVARALSK
jgi:hypothetical protein